MPTGAPTTKPTPNPTRSPTASPTRQPTAAPTQTPTKVPTARPTRAPKAVLVHFDSLPTVAPARNTEIFSNLNNELVLNRNFLYSSYTSHPGDSGYQALAAIGSSPNHGVLWPSAWGGPDAAFSPTAAGATISLTSFLTSPRYLNAPQDVTVTGFDANGVAVASHRYTADSAKTIQLDGFDRLSRIEFNNAGLVAVDDMNVVIHYD
ncbi:expressed unknown protein [Seminavis robusta]|uniref:Uncharacterized protein n=1 Tax=Seminavis robusta TaxID=568900 RepID=A0A9N8E9Z5_9STRA|nr:expressed unknown protein [Seminavis robusta]|eukprot:Sro842_g209740.1 n/a (206) ;mRNA; r:36210-36827